MRRLRRTIQAFLQVALFVMISTTIIVPQAKTISFCHPMEQVMLRACCYSQKIQVKNGDDSVSNSSCCDEISLPKAEKDSISIVVLPPPLIGNAWPELPDVDWIALTEVDETPIMLARGPPPDHTPIFIKNCSYLI